MLIREERLECVGCRIQCKFVYLSNAGEIRGRHLILLLQLHVLKHKWFESLFYKLKSNRLFALEPMKIVLVFVFIFILIMTTEHRLVVLLLIRCSLFQQSSFFLGNNHTIILVLIVWFHVLKAIVVIVRNINYFVNRSHSLSFLLLVISFLRELSLS